MRTKKKNEDQGSSVLKTIAIGAAVVGAGALAADALSKEENREKLKETKDKLIDKGKEVVTSIREGAADARGDVETEYQELADKLDQRLAKNGRGKTKNKGLQALQKKVQDIRADIDELKDMAEEKRDSALENIKQRVMELRQEFNLES